MKIKLNQSNALDFVVYWGEYKTESGVYIEFIDFDEIEISLDTNNNEYTMEDAAEYVKNVHFNTYN